MPKLSFRLLGNILIIVGVAFLAFTFWPVAREETKYQINQITKKPFDLTPPNSDFSIVIPKIEAKAPIIANADASDPKKYLPALKMGVAHAQGSKFPGQVGNIYLFAHSTDAFYNVSAYNAVFYLIGKLEKGNEIDIYYKGTKYQYEVYDKMVVGADASQFFGTLPRQEGLQTLTLQTCYPPGTSIKRLVVLAKVVRVN